MDEEEVVPKTNGKLYPNALDFEEMVTKRFELLEARFETGEQHSAELTKAYMELSAMFEAFANVYFGSKDSPAAEQFRKTVADIKGAMYNWMEHAAEHVASGEDSLNDAVLRLVRQEQSADGPTPGDPGAGDGEASPSSE